jgi:YHS domain-containing protein
MKKLILIATIALFVSCKKEETKDLKKDSVVMEQPENPLNKLKYANKVDYYCKMDIKLGVGDTITYKGKLYGFCSSVCKDGFMKNPDEYLAKAK